MTRRGREAVVLAVLALDAALLGLTELAWLPTRVGEQAVPWAVLLALVSTPLLAGLARRARPGSSAPYVPVVVWAVVVLVVGAWSPAGAGWLPADPRAVALIAAGVLPGVAVAWRRPTEASAEGSTQG